MKNDAKTGDVLFKSAFAVSCGVVGIFAFYWSIREAIKLYKNIVQNYPIIETETAPFFFFGFSLLFIITAIFIILYSVFGIQWQKLKKALTACFISSFLLGLLLPIIGFPLLQYYISNQGYHYCRALAPVSSYRVLTRIWVDDLALCKPPE